MKCPTDLSYTKDHEWIKVAKGNVTVGITDHAQSALGDIVFVELPTIGRMLKQGETFGVVESIKAVSDLYSPVAGKVLEVNGSLTAEPGAVNRDPYSSWMIRLETSGAGGADLMDSSAYEKYVAALK